MKYAVIFHSETGNTEKIAREIFDSLESYDKEFINLDTYSYIPDADVYIVGFPIRNQSCSIKVIECLEDITTGKIALFATCGLQPAEKYKDRLEESLSVWLPDNAEYLGMFICQGRTEEGQKEYFYAVHPKHKDKIRRMMDEGERHPDRADLENAAVFAKRVEAVTRKM